LGKAYTYLRMCSRKCIIGSLGVCAVLIAILAQIGLSNGRISSLWTFASVFPTFFVVVVHYSTHGLPAMPMEHWEPGAFHVRPSDVIFAVPSKSGTTLLTHIGHQLRMRGAEPDFDDFYDVLPWLEVQGGLGDDLNAEQRAKPRLFKSHLTLDRLPKGARYVYCFRDPKDAMVSLFRFMEPLMAAPEGMLSLDVFAEASLLGGAVHGALRELLLWWELRHDPNVFFTFYEELLISRESNVKRLADFLQVDYRSNATLIPTVLEQSQLSFMNSPQHRGRYDTYQFLLRLAKAQGKLAPPRESLVGTVRKGGGKSGEGASALSAATRKAFELAWRAVITPALNFTSLDEMRQAWRAELS